MDPNQDETKVQLYAEPSTAEQSSVTSSVWSLLPDTKATENMVDRAGLVTITDAAAAYGQNYYNGTYPTSYGMYGNNAYYQVATGLRAPNAAAAAATFPYTLGSATQTYYGSSYPGGLNFNDYTAYNPQYYNNMRTASYYGSALTAGAAYAQGASLAAEASTSADLNGFATKDKKSKSSKKKKSGSCSPGDTQYTRVFIWELDDICPISTTNLNAVEQNCPQFASACVQLKHAAVRIITQTFSMEHPEEFELCNVEDAAVEDGLTDGSLVDGRGGGVEVMRRLASKYFSLRQLFQECSVKPADVVNYSLLDRCGLSSQKEQISAAAKEIDTLFINRIHAARRCLDLVLQRSSNSDSKYANVVVCSDGLIQGIAQLLLASESTSVSIDNIYSSSKSGKESVLDRIQTRFGKKCSYVIVSSNRDTATIAKKENIPLWTVNSTEDLEKLYSAQSHFLLEQERQT